MVQYHLAGLPSFAITQFQPTQENSRIKTRRLKFHATHVDQMRPNICAARHVGLTIIVSATVLTTKRAEAAPSTSTFNSTIRFSYSVSLSRLLLVFSI
jgi:hypothetical protein